jgi:uncharacterized damage-inducible protein DinB
MSVSALSAEFISKSVFRIGENVPRIIKCLNELSEEEIWERPNSSSNSVGNLILHACGNIKQYIFSGLGGKEDLRQRDKEFSASDGYNRNELINKLTDTITETTAVINGLTDKELLNNKKVQGNEHSGISMVIHVTEHLSYHTGQIAFYTKMLKDKDLGFYKGQNLNLKNQ